MDINLSGIDNNRSFDFGKTSKDYATYRDIYPESLYEKLYSLGICTENQKVLDIGTGTGVIPRNMYKYGAEFTATDISSEQIKAAVEMSEAQGKNIRYLCCPTEELRFEPKSFDVITACQCYFYFDHNVTAPLLSKMLKDKGKLAFVYMGWLPDEDKVANASEKLVLKYNPSWTGYGDYRHEIDVPEVYKDFFMAEHSEIFDVKIPFTKDSWNGRIKTCRGIGASLSEEKVLEFEREHMKLLSQITDDRFEISHYCAVTILTKK